LGDITSRSGDREEGRWCGPKMVLFFLGRSLI
jgi:hypothetical protein